MDHLFVIPEWELEFTYARSSGPGGQNVNKVNSKALLKWNLFNTTALRIEDKERVIARLAGKLTEAGEIQITCDESRSQLFNKDRCRERLLEMVSEALIPEKKRFKTKVPRSVKRKNADMKKRHSSKKKQRSNYDY